MASKIKALPQRQQNNKNMQANSYRTTDQVQKALVARPKSAGKRKSRKNMNMAKFYDMAYAHCRLDPFRASGGGMIPDGSGRRVMVDHRRFIDFTTTANGQMSILIVPFLPFPALFKPGDTTAFSLEGTSITQTTGAGFNRDWIPSTPYAEFLPGYTPGNVVETPFEAARARIVTQAYRLIYTGSAANCQGSVLAQTFPLDMPQHIEHGNYITAMNLATGATDATFAANANAILEVAINGNDLNSTLTTVTNDVVSARPEQGLCGLLKKQSPINNWKDVQNNPLVVITDAFFGSSLTPTSVINTFVCDNVNGVTGRGGVIFHDDNFEAQYVTIRNSAAGSPFRLEIITCVEYQVPNSSMVARFSKMAPNSNEQTLKLVDSVMAKTPIAVSANESESWWRVFLRSINSASKIGQAVPDPYISLGSSFIGALTSVF